jgi:hypothetical protein
VNNIGFMDVGKSDFARLGDRWAGATIIIGDEAISQVN